MQRLWPPWTDDIWHICHTRGSGHWFTLSFIPGLSSQHDKNSNCAYRNFTTCQVLGRNSSQWHINSRHLHCKPTRVNTERWLKVMGGQCAKVYEKWLSWFPNFPKSGKNRRLLSDSRYNVDFWLDSVPEVVCKFWPTCPTPTHLFWKRCSSVSFWVYPNHTLLLMCKTLRILIETVQQLSQ